MEGRICIGLFKHLLQLCLSESIFFESWLARSDCELTVWRYSVPGLLQKCLALNHRSTLGPGPKTSSHNTRCLYVSSILNLVKFAMAELAVHLIRGSRACESLTVRSEQILMRTS